jgi:hypothetical protein
MHPHVRPWSTPAAQDEDSHGGTLNPLLQQLFGIGGGGSPNMPSNMKVVKLEDLDVGDEQDGLVKMMAKALEAAGMSHDGISARANPGRHQPVSTLPPFEPNMPVSGVLSSIRESLAASTARHAAARGGNAGAGSPGVDYIDHLDAAGLNALELELQEKLARVDRARRRLANANGGAGWTAAGAGGASGRSSAEAEMGAADDDDDGGVEERGTAVGPGESVAEAIRRIMERSRSGRGEGVERRLGHAAAETREADALKDAQDETQSETQSYADRLVAEARSRELGTPDDDGDKGRGRAGQPRTLADELFAQAFGRQADEGEIFEMNFVVGGANGEDGGVEVQLEGNSELVELLQGSLREVGAPGSDHGEQHDGVGDDTDTDEEVDER